MSMIDPRITISNEQVILLVYCGFVKGTKDIIEESKRALGPNDEAADVTTRRELKEVEATDIDHFNSRQVTESLDNTIVLIVDDEGAAALTVPAVAHLSLSRSKLARVGNLYNVAVCAEGLEKCNGFLCLAEGLDRVADNKGNFFNLLDAVAASKDERRKRRCGEGGNGSKAALILVHFDVPSTPGFRGREHPTTTAHVTERCLT